MVLTLCWHFIELFQRRVHHRGWNCVFAVNIASGFNQFLLIHCTRTDHQTRGTVGVATQCWGTACGAVDFCHGRAAVGFVFKFKSFTGYRDVGIGDEDVGRMDCARYLATCITVTGHCAHDFGVACIVKLPAEA